MQVLLLLGLLGLIAGDAAVAGAASAPGGCDATTLAAEVASSCAAGVATPACCDPLLGSVGVGGGDCFCHMAYKVAAVQEGLNASVLVTLYTACGGAGVSSTDTACQAPAPLLPAADNTAASSSPVARPWQPPRKNLRHRTLNEDEACDSEKLAAHIASACSGNRVNGPCCTAVLPAVDIPECLCTVMGEQAVQNAAMNTSMVFKWYSYCAGTPTAPNSITCSGGSSAPGTPPVTSQASGTPIIFEEHLDKQDRDLLKVAEAAGISQMFITVVVVVFKLGKLAWNCYKNGACGGASPPRRG